MKELEEGGERKMQRIKYLWDRVRKEFMLIRFLKR